MALEQQVQFCTTRNGVRIAYTTNGQDRPVVRVLGWLSHLGVDSTGPFWAPWVTALGPQYQLVRHDGRGMGLSDREVTDWCLPNGPILDGAEAVQERRCLRVGRRFTARL